MSPIAAEAAAAGITVNAAYIRRYNARKLTGEPPACKGGRPRHPALAEGSTFEGAVSAGTGQPVVRFPLIAIRALGLEPGDVVTWTFTDGALVVRKAVRS